MNRMFDRTLPSSAIRNGRPEETYLVPIPAQLRPDELRHVRLAACILVAGLSLIVPMMSSAGDSELSALSWLAGCWAAEEGEAGSGEQWMALAGETMLGVARSVKDGETVEHEFLQIRRSAEGKIVYIALPSGQAEVSFTMTSATEDSVVFENPQHDFPQRITYRLRPYGRLAVRIEGKRGGAMSGVDFPMRRVPCEALSAQ